MEREAMIEKMVRRLAKVGVSMRVTTHIIALRCDWCCVRWSPLIRGPRGGYRRRRGFWLCPSCSNAEQERLPS